jgi:hypothetical protein
VRPALASITGRVVHQPGEAAPSIVADMTTDAQVLAQHRLAFEREREAEVAVEVALVRLVEQHRGDAAEFLVAEDALTKIASVTTSTRVAARACCRAGSGSRRAWPTGSPSSSAIARPRRARATRARAEQMTWPVHHGRRSARATAVVLPAPGAR